MFSTLPIDIIDNNKNWIFSYRYEPYLDKWFLIDPELPAKLRIADTKSLPKQVINVAEKTELVNVTNSYSAPIKLQIQLNKNCNYSCPMCYALSGKHNSTLNDLSFQELNNPFRKAKEIGIIRINFVGGEIFMRKDIEKIVNAAIETPLWINFSNDYRTFEFYFSPEARDDIYISSEGDIYPFPLLSGIKEFKVGNVREDSILDIWRNSEILNRIRKVNFESSDCGKLNCKKVCGLWNRSYAIASTGKFEGKVPCELTEWK